MSKKPQKRPKLPQTVRFFLIKKYNFFQKYQPTRGFSLLVNSGGGSVDLECQLSQENQSG